MVKLLRAFFMLALRALVLQPWVRLWRGSGVTGEQRFLAAFSPEGLLPYSARERDELSSFSACVSCGLCDAVCPLPGTVPLRDFGGPSLFARAYSRSTPQLGSLRAPLAVLDGCGTCSLCQGACPRGVPLLRIFAFTRRKLAELDEAT